MQVVGERPHFLLVEVDEEPLAENHRPAGFLAQPAEQAPARRSPLELQLPALPVEVDEKPLAENHRPAGFLAQPAEQAPARRSLLEIQLHRLAPAVGPL